VSALSLSRPKEEENEGSFNYKQISTKLPACQVKWAFFFTNFPIFGPVFHPPSTCCLLTPYFAACCNFKAPSPQHQGGRQKKTPARYWYASFCPDACLGIPERVLLCRKPKAASVMGREELKGTPDNSKSWIKNSPSCPAPHGRGLENAIPRGCLECFRQSERVWRRSRGGTPLRHTGKMPVPQPCTGRQSACATASYWPAKCLCHSLALAGKAPVPLAAGVLIHVLRGIWYAQFAHLRSASCRGYVSEKTRWIVTFRIVVAAFFRVFQRLFGLTTLSGTPSLPLVKRMRGGLGRYFGILCKDD